MYKDKNKKIVVKISSNLLNPDLKFNIIEKLAEEISFLNSKDFKVIIVTSGAVMHGMKCLNYDKKPVYLPLLQSLASVGQIQLMSKYQSVFSNYKLICSQILVSIDDFKIRKRYLNLRNTVQSLLDINAIPIFNENDSVNTEELKFGDNDQLSSLLTIMVDFDQLIILTDVDGLYDKDPNENNDAKLIATIENINEKYLDFANAKTSKYSRGGMKSKLQASMDASKAGVNVFIGNGNKVSLLKIIEKKETGTYILSSNKNVNARKKWLGLSPTGKVEIAIDDGAYRALKNNSSLLAIGITSVKGNFQRGSIINVLHNGKKIAQGLSNYSSKEVELIKGRKSAEFITILKNSDYQEVIHKDNLYLL